MKIDGITCETGGALAVAVAPSERARTGSECARDVAACASNTAADEGKGTGDMNKRRAEVGGCGPVARWGNGGTGGSEGGV